MHYPFSICFGEEWFDVIIEADSYDEAENKVGEATATLTFDGKTIEVQNDNFEFDEYDDGELSIEEVDALKVAEEAKAAKKAEMNARERDQRPVAKSGKPSRWKVVKE
jgi:hypothetical protein